MPKEVRKRKHGRLGLCDVCKAVDALYTCPKCETVTCSLTCAKGHKKQLDCDGIRVRTKYIPISKMDELTFLSDYRLMEDIEKCVSTVVAIRESADVIPQSHYVDDGSDKPAKQIEEVKKTCEDEDPTKNICLNPEKGTKIKEPGKGRSKRPRNRVKKSTAELVSKATQIRETILKRKAIADNKSVINNESSTHTDIVEAEATVKNLNKTAPEPICQNLTVPCEIGDTKPENVSEMPKEIGNAKYPDVANTKLKSRSQVRNAVKKHGERKEMILNTLMKAAQSRGIYLSFLPDNFEKHWENTSFYLVKEKCIYWKLRVSFINANMFTLNINECDEATSLRKLITKCLKRSQKYSRENQIEDPLSVYRSAGISGMSVLMTADRLPSCQKKFYLLDMHKSLVENFVGKCIVEFPQLCIALDGCHTVAKVKDNVETRFFDFDDKLEKCPISSTDEDRFQKKLQKGRQKKKPQKIKKEKKVKCSNDTESDRESGELTDSESDGFGSDDYSNSDEREELYDDTEFRSMYKDLLKTFDVDVKQVK
ncbi:unnamed protein product [Orchesella dallaii]|uniref:HIT-type domain-containing protein n=1 Tax=Orchesella dallaii TaxID=48710 RepID=A0ABP1Q2R0_9HEXA